MFKKVALCSVLAFSAIAPATIVPFSASAASTQQAQKVLSESNAQFTITVPNLKERRNLTATFFDETETYENVILLDFDTLEDNVAFPFLEIETTNKNARHLDGYIEYGAGQVGGFDGEFKNGKIKIDLFNAATLRAMAGANPLFMDFYIWDDKEQKLMTVKVHFAFNVSALPTFKDVPSTHWAKNEIYYLTEREIITGFENNVFKPSGDVTRAQAAAMIVRALNLDTTDRPSINLKNVAPTHWAYNDILTLMDAGIWDKNDTNFNPSAPLLRYEMALMLEKAYGLEGHSGKEFKDVAKSNQAYTAIQALAANNITTGVTPTTFEPNQKVNRAQFSVFLARVLDESFR